MEPSASDLSVAFKTALAEVEIESAVPHKDAMEAHLEHIRSSAFEEGRRAQSAALTEESDKLNAQLRQQTSELLHSITKAVPDLLQQAEFALKDLAITVARKYVADCPVDAERIHAILKETLSKLEDAHKVTVRLHPDDLALIETESEPIKARLPHPDAVSFRPSVDITRGGCQIDTEFGHLDASVESKYQQINGLVVGSSLVA